MGTSPADGYTASSSQVSDTSVIVTFVSGNQKETISASLDSFRRAADQRHRHHHRQLTLDVELLYWISQAGVRRARPPLATASCG
ncbi:hypothetical protein [Fodinicola feengrottensis]|uniref:hypothetical protein n=1 Tax=Fodinicola feengrottensis TaxID=435914 RepID=UPI002442160B|nr:hypothetical protein [Fodinicola feengrottensis]